MFNFNDLSPSSSSVLTGRYSGLCETLQRHLRVVGVRLPAGPHLSDTSLLLGRYQSQLPREQLRLEPCTAGSTNHSFICFVSDLKPVV